MPSTPAHEWFKPRLEALLAQAAEAGYAPDLSQAVITDLVNGALAAPMAPLPSEDNWAQDIGEPAELAHEMPTTPGLPPETGSNDPRNDFPNGISGGRGVDI